MVIDTQPEQERTPDERRSDLALMNRAVAQLEKDLALAEAEADRFERDLAEINGQIGALMPVGGRYVHLPDGGVSVTGVKDRATERRIIGLVQSRIQREHEREQWLRERSSTGVGLDGQSITKSMVPTNVRERLRQATLFRDRLAAELEVR